MNCLQKWYKILLDTTHIDELLTDEGCELLTKVVQDTIRHNGERFHKKPQNVVNCLQKWYKILLDTTNTLQRSEYLDATP